MTLDDLQVKEIIKSPPHKALISEKQKESKILKMHFTGIGINDFIKNIPEFMRDGMKETLVSMARSNRNILARTLAPRDKIFTAKGGIEHYNLKGNKEGEFKDYLSEITEGLSLTQWVKQHAMKAFDYDPNSVVFVEVNEYGNPYPTIKSINDIYEYKLNGRKVEYIAISITGEQRAEYIREGYVPNTISKKTNVYRVVCDSFDRICIADGQNVTITSAIPNPFGYVPGLIVSNRIGYEYCSFDASIGDFVDLLNSYMFAGATYNLAYARQAFPKEWMQKFDCPTCEGQKQLDGNNCPECKGRGILVSIRQADVAIVDYSGEGGEKIPNPPIGVVMPATEALQFMKDNGISLEDYIWFTMWGIAKVSADSGSLSHSVRKTGGNVSGTAFEAQLNLQPQYDKLRELSAWKDSIIKFVVDTCAYLMYGNSYKGAAILSGDRYMIESPDSTIDRYFQAVQSKAPMAELDSLYLEYIENKYNNNPLMYRKYLLLMQVEPFVHEDVSIIWADNSLPMVTRLEKKYFDEWTSTLTDYDIANVPDEGGADILRAKLREFVTGKYVADTTADAQLFTAMGVSIDLGDEVEVKQGKALDDSHYGKIFTVSSIMNGMVNMTGGNDGQGASYKVTDIQKIPNKLIIT